MRFFLSSVRGEIDNAVRELQRPVAEAATAAVRDAGNAAVKDGRAGIARAGFSQKWQNALRSDVYPKNRVSMRPAAHIRHKIPYAGVFEEGATIPGRPLLWLPLPTVPVGPGGRRLTPKKFIAQGNQLVSVKRPGKRPLLVGKVGDKSVPLFFGIPTVTIRKKFDVVAAVRRAAARLGEFYLKNLKS
jgi:hypothetical protein